MGLLKKLRDWDASYGQEGQVTPTGGGGAGSGTRSSPGPGEAQVVAIILKVVALVEATLGVLVGMIVGFAVGDTVDGDGFDPVGIVVSVAALVNALLFWALAVGLGCLDDIRRNTSRTATP